MKGYVVLSKNKDNEDLPNRHIFELNLADGQVVDVSLSLDGEAWCGQVLTSLELIKDQGPTIYAIGKMNAAQWERSEIKSLPALADFEKVLEKASANLCEDCMELFDDN